MNKLTRKLKALLAFSTAFALLGSCSEDEDNTKIEQSKIEISSLSIGEEGKLIAHAGEDLEISGVIKSEVELKEATLSIEPKQEGAWKVQDKLDLAESKTQNKTWELSKKIAVPEDAAEGEYLLKISILDVNGGKVEKIETIKVGKDAEHNHDHEQEWSKVEITFTQGHAHGELTATKGYFHGNSSPEEVKYLKAQQKLVFYNKDGNIEADQANQPIRWKAMANGQPNSALYGIRIMYFNEKGENINNEVAELHQHFFLAKNLRKNQNAPQDYQIPSDDSFIRFIYRDTTKDELEYKGNLRSENDPVGLKGVFEASVPYVDFDLRIILAHFVVAEERQKGHPFNKMPLDVAQKEAEFTIPVRVYTKIGSGNEDVKKEFGITDQDIENDEDILVSIDPEGPYGSPVLM